MRLPAFPFALTALLLAMVMLIPQAAFAISLPTRQCGELSMTAAPPVTTAVPELSKLETMRMQQEAAFVPRLVVTNPADITAIQGANFCALGRVIKNAPLHQANTNPAEQLLIATDRPDVFGSIALPVSHTPLDAKWRAANNAQLPTAGPWASLIRSVSGSGRDQQLRAVNIWVNARVRFTNDRPSKYGADRWAGANETLRRSQGDCEDYAIAKMKLLEAVGISRTDMYLVIAKDLVRRADHALLVVRLGSRFMVLDNSNDQLLDAQQLSDYRPIMSYGAKGAWLHGYAEKPVRIAATF